MPVQGDLFSNQSFQPDSTQPQTPAAPVAEAATPKTPRVTLVDASGFIFRAYHALPPLTTSKGTPTHAALGFTRMVLKLLRERAPTHMALCFDKDSRKGRLAIDPNYKANREAPPSDLVSQFDLIRKIAGVLNLPILEVEGWEADDVIATLVLQARAKGFEVEIVTSDKDFLQLLAPDVRIYDAMKDKNLGEADAIEKFGVKPSQMRDYQALVGDAIDNIPKVPGIGPKTASELLSEFGSIDVLLTRLAEVKKPKIREALTTNVEQLKRALALVSFRDNLPLTVAIDELARKPIFDAQARALFTELEFFRLIGEMPAPPPTPLRRNATVVQDAVSCASFVSVVERAKSMSMVPVFTGEAHTPHVIWLAADFGTEGSFLLNPSLQEHWATVREALEKAFSTGKVGLIGHDTKATLHCLFAHGVKAVPAMTDIELLSFILNPGRKEHALADLARERLQTELPALDKGAIDPVAAQTFACAAADAIGRLAPALWTEVEGVGLAPVAKELDLKLIPVLASMERAGVALDSSALQEISTQVTASMEILLADVYRHAGREFNVGSPLQLAQVLYDELKLPVLKKNKTGPSTDHEVLEKLAELHPLPNAISEYRNVAKLKSTYLDTLPSLVGADGRIRTTFNQAAAATGRLSSTNPNLQNIPIRTELGKQIRRAFIAAPGCVLVSADYSQIELRILAHIAGDEGLVRAFSENADVHARTAAEVFGVAESDVTADQRRAAKMVNYGIAYGLSAHGLSTRLNIKAEEAKDIIDRYFARFAGIATYVQSTIEKARKSGYVETLFGRRRYMGDINSRNRNVSGAAERAAINMPIQGTAADLMKRAMLEVDRRLKTTGFRGQMLLQVHDELLLECPTAETEQLTALVRDALMGAGSLKVPLLVEVGVGQSWAAAH